MYGSDVSSRAVMSLFFIVITYLLRSFGSIFFDFFPIISLECSKRCACFNACCSSCSGAHYVFSNDHETGRCPSIAKDDICRQNPRFKFIRYHVTVPRDGNIRIFCVQYSEFPDSKPLSYQKTLFPWDAAMISPLNAFHPR